MPKITSFTHFLNVLLLGIFTTFSSNSYAETYNNAENSNHSINVSVSNTESGIAGFPGVLESTQTQNENQPFIDVDNRDRFPAKEHLTFSRIQIPWKRSTGPYNHNHDLVTVRVTNKGAAPLTINNLVISNNDYFVIDKIVGTTYGGSLPVQLNTREFIDVTIKFIAVNPGSWKWIKILHEKLTIHSNDPLAPEKQVFLHGLWQLQGEDKYEPTAQDMIDAFGFKTRTGFGMNDPDKGDPNKLKGDEIFSPYFVRADPNKPVYARQMAAYHGCCNDTETFRYNKKGSSEHVDIFRHIREDGQSLLPRSNLNGTPAEKEFSPVDEVFGFKIKNDYTDPTLNNHPNYPSHNNKLGVRIWKVYDAEGKIVPNAYIIANDYLGTQWTNYDYNDNLYYVSNIKPEVGTAYYSELSPSPSNFDFGNKETGSTHNLTLNLKSLGKTYNNGTADPAVVISKVEIVGLHKSEFTASSPGSTNLAPQASTSLTVQFKPTTSGFKKAYLMVHYNMSGSPLRVPLYAIATDDCKEVTEHLRIKSGSNSNVEVNGKTWISDTPYRKGNIKLDVPAHVNEIAGTDDDQVYINYLSSTGDHNVIRYEVPVTNGDYMVRLHFSENFWTQPGQRVFSIKLENDIKLHNFDILREVPPRTALVKNIPVTVNDELLNIDFTPTVNRLSLAAVEIYKVNDGAGISLSANVTNSSCDLSNGEINASAGDSQQITFKLNEDGTYQNSGKFENVAAGIYTLYAKAPSGDCEATMQVEVLDSGCPNDPPVVNNPINDQAAKEGKAYNFTFPVDTFADPDPDDALTYTATLANDDALPDWLTFNALSRTFSGTPGSSDVGTIEIKVTATDKRNEHVSDYFLLSVAGINDPFIEDIADIMVLQDTQIGPIQFVISPGDLNINSITIASESDNEDLIPVANISLNGNGEERTFTINPVGGKYGIANITLIIDGNEPEVSRTFKVTVLKNSTFPTVSNIDDVSISMNTSTGPLEFTVSDENNEEHNLIITGLSDNQELVPDGNIAFGGSNANRTVTVMPAQDKIGTAKITIQVYDGKSMATTSFNVKVDPITSIGPEKLPSKIKLYPNPTQNNLTVQLDNQVMGNVQLLVMDTKGKILRSATFNKGSDFVEFDLNLEQITLGTYIIKIQQQDNVTIKKFIKN